MKTDLATTDGDGQLITGVEMMSICERGVTVDGSPAGWHGGAKSFL